MAGCARPSSRFLNTHTRSIAVLLGMGLWWELYWPAALPALRASSPSRSVRPARDGHRGNCDTPSGGRGVIWQFDAVSASVLHTLEPIVGDTASTVLALNALSHAVGRVMSPFDGVPQALAGC